MMSGAGIWFSLGEVVNDCFKYNLQIGWLATDLSRRHSFPRKALMRFISAIN